MYRSPDGCAVIAWAAFASHFKPRTPFGCVQAKRSVFFGKKRETGKHSRSKHPGKWSADDQPALRTAHLLGPSCVLPDGIPSTLRNPPRSHNFCRFQGHSTDIACTTLIRRETSNGFGDVRSCPTGFRRRGQAHEQETCPVAGNAAVVRLSVFRLSKGRSGGL
jgi:hypothetical protein